MKLNAVMVLIILCMGFFIAWQCQSNKVAKLHGMEEARVFRDSIKTFENQVAVSEVKIKTLQEGREKYTDSVKSAHRPVRVRLQADLDTISSLRSKLAPRLAKNPDINELAEAQAKAYSRLDSLYKGSELAHNAEIVNLESQLKERGKQILSKDQVIAALEGRNQELEKDLKKQKRRTGFWKFLAAVGITTAGVIAATSQ